MPLLDSLMQRGRLMTQLLSLPVQEEEWLQKC